MQDTLEHEVAVEQDASAWLDATLKQNAWRIPQSKAGVGGNLSVSIKPMRLVYKLPEGATLNGDKFTLSAEVPKGAKVTIFMRKKDPQNGDALLTVFGPDGGAVATLRQGLGFPLSSERRYIPSRSARVVGRA